MKNEDTLLQAAGYLRYIRKVFDFITFARIPRGKTTGNALDSIFNKLRWFAGCGMPIALYILRK
jgi:hypothetical protein